MNHRRDCCPRLRHVIRHPSCGLAPNAPDARNSVAANSAAPEMSAATNNRDSHSHSNCTTADFPGTPNSSAAASTNADRSNRSSADSPNNCDYRRADWRPLAAGRTASGSNQIRRARGRDRWYFPEPPSCGCCPRLAAGTMTLHCPAHFLRRTDGWRSPQLRSPPSYRSSDSARRYPLVRDWPKNDSARKPAAWRHCCEFRQLLQNSAASAQSSRGWLPARLAAMIRLGDTRHGLPPARRRNCCAKTP